MRCEVAARLRGVVNIEVPVVNSRQVEWQQKNRERYNLKMREWMRKKRAKGG